MVVPVKQTAQERVGLKRRRATNFELCPTHRHLTEAIRASEARKIALSWVASLTGKPGELK